MLECLQGQGVAEEAESENRAMTDLPPLPAPREPAYGVASMRDVIRAFDERYARELLATEISMSISQSSAGFARAMLETYLHRRRAQPPADADAAEVVP